ncbi:hypothetical protein ACLOJK_018103 [Asimina triloba]
MKQKEDLIADLEAHVQTLDSSLADASGKLAKVEADKESLLNENASLSKTVKKLTRDVAKVLNFVFFSLDFDHRIQKESFGR